MCPLDVPLSRENLSCAGASTILPIFTIATIFTILTILTNLSGSVIDIGQIFVEQILFDQLFVEISAKRY